MAPRYHSAVRVLVEVVIARNPESLVVGGPVKLRLLVTDGKILQVRLLRKLVAKAQPIIKQPEAQHQLPVFYRGLLHGHGQFLVVVANLLHLAPHRRPGIVMPTGIDFGDGKALVETGLGLKQHRQPAGVYHRLLPVAKLVRRLPRRAELKLQRQLAAGGMDGLSVGTDTEA